MNKTIHYLPCSVVCHGESELVLIKQIQNKKRRSLNPLSERNGKGCVEINTLNKYLSRQFPSKNDYIKQYKNVLCLRNKREIINHQIFALIDKDETSDAVFESYKSKKLFDGFWWGQEKLIVPLYFNPNMDIIFTNHGFPIDTNKSKPAQYFKYLTTRYDDIMDMLYSLNNRESNIKELLCYLDALD